MLPRVLSRKLKGLPNEALEDDLAALHHAPHEVHAGMVGEEAERRRVEDEEVGVLARLDASEALLKAKGSGGAQGEGGQGFLYREAHVEDGEGEDKGNGLAVAGAGVEVGGEGQGTA